MNYSRMYHGTTNDYMEAKKYSHAVGDDVSVLDMCQIQTHFRHAKNRIRYVSNKIKRKYHVIVISKLIINYV